MAGGTLVVYLGSSLAAAFAVLVSVTILSTVAVIRHELRRDEGLSFISLSALFYLLAFGVGPIYLFAYAGQFQGTNFYLLYEREDLVVAVATGAVAWHLFLAGWVKAPVRTLFSTFPGLAVTGPRPVGTSGLLSLYLLGWVARLYVFATGSYFSYAADGGPVAATGASLAITIVSTLPLLVAAYVGAEIGLRPETTWNRKLFYGLMLAEVAWALPTGARRYVVAAMIAGLVILYYSKTWKVPKRSLAAASLVLLLVVFPFALSYRRDNPYYNVDTGKALTDAAANTFGNGPVVFLGRGVSALAERFSDAGAVAILIRRGPEAMDLPPGQTLWWSLETVVPRALAPDKVDPSRFGNTWAQAYGIAASGNLTTNITLTQPGEMYLNYGFLGVVLGMPIIGAAYRFLYEVLGRYREDPAILALYAVTAWSIIGSHENIVAAGLFGTAKVTLVLWGFLWGAAWLSTGQSNSRQGVASPVAG